VAEAALAFSLLDEVSRGPWKRFRLNVAVNDTDDAKEGTAKLWRRPDWPSGEDYAGSGIFERSGP
jgi:hypothetical protein